MSLRRPPIRRDFIDRPANVCEPTPDVVEIAMARLSKELRAREVTMTVEELDATRLERFGRGDEVEEKRLAGIFLEPICERCGRDLVQDEETGFWKHEQIEPGHWCVVPTLHFREARL